MDYNTGRGHLSMREYGRHIQKMVDYHLTIEDRAVRQKNANAVIELMGFLNPQLKLMEDYRHKLWDHLFLISDFQLDVDSPYPIPTRESIKAKPEPLHYPKKYPRYNHLGKHLELLIDKAMLEQNPEKRQSFANAIAYYMKLTYNNWHRENVHDEAIRQELDSITDGQLEFTATPPLKAFKEPGREDRFVKRGKPGGGYPQRMGGNGRGPQQGGGQPNKNRPQQRFQKKRFK